jgi:hypothetical protein
VRKLLLNLALGETLSSVEEIIYLHNPIKMDPLLASNLDLCVHYLINGSLFHAVRLIYVGVSYYAISEVSNNVGKYGRRRSTLNTG